MFLMCAVIDNISDVTCALQQMIILNSFSYMIVSIRFSLISYAIVLFWSFNFLYAMNQEVACIGNMTSAVQSSENLPKEIIDAIVISAKNSCYEARLDNSCLSLKSDILLKDYVIPLRLVNKLFYQSVGGMLVKLEAEMVTREEFVSLYQKNLNELQGQEGYKLFNAKCQEALLKEHDNRELFDISDDLRLLYLVYCHCPGAHFSYRVTENNKYGYMGLVIEAYSILNSQNCEVDSSKYLISDNDRAGLILSIVKSVAHQSIQKNLQRDRLTYTNNLATALGSKQWNALHLYAQKRGIPHTAFAAIERYKKHCQGFEGGNFCHKGYALLFQHIIDQVVRKLEKETYHHYSRFLYVYRLYRFISIQYENMRSNMRNFFSDFFY